VNGIGPNPVYALMESPYRWLILAGISFVACLLGTMMMLAYTWPHSLARGWLYLTILLTAYFLVQALLDWRAQLPDPGGAPSTHESPATEPAGQDRS